jgi:hypothetical protein
VSILVALALSLMRARARLRVKRRWLHDIKIAVEIPRRSGHTLRRRDTMDRKLFVALASMLAVIAYTMAPAVAHAETKTLVSSANNSLCVNPTSGFEPEINGMLSFLPLETPNSGPFLDTGTACESGRVTHPAAMGSPGQAVSPYTGAIPGASWVSIVRSGSDASNPAPKYYIYDATFQLCERQLKGSEVAGSMFADNVAGAFLNGEPIGTQRYPGTTENFDAVPHGAWAFGTSTNFQAGTNTLQFVVLDETVSYTALDFSATVTTPTPASECGENQWYSNGKLIPAGEVVAVSTTGELTFKHFVVEEFEVNCKLTDTETIENPGSGVAGAGKLTSITFSPCVYGGRGQLPGNPIGPCTVAADGLPWNMGLPHGTPATEEIENMEVEVVCGPYHETYTGSLVPLVGPSVLTFTLATGDLGNQSTPTSPVVGYDEMQGPEGDETITSEPPEPAPEFPGLGRCVKAARRTGKYNDSGCETPEVPNGSHEWLPGAVKNKFTSKEKLSTFETVGHVRLVCKTDVDAGEYLGESEDLETIVFKDCDSESGHEGAECTNGPGIIKTKPLRSLYGFIRRPSTVGVSLEPTWGTAIAEFSCGGPQGYIAGSVIAPVTPISKMTKTFKESFEEQGGKQHPESFENEPVDTLSCLIPPATMPEQCALKSTDKITNEEKLEIREAP